MVLESNNNQKTFFSFITGSRKILKCFNTVVSCTKYLIGRVTISFKKKFDFNCTQDTGVINKQFRVLIEEKFL